MSEPLVDSDSGSPLWVTVAAQGLERAADWLDREVSEARENPTNISQSDLEEERPRILDLFVHPGTVQDLRTGLRDIAAASEMKLAARLAYWFDAEAEEALQYKEPDYRLVHLIVKASQIDHFRSGLRKLARDLREVTP